MNSWARSARIVAVSLAVLSLLFRTASGQAPALSDQQANDAIQKLIASQQKADSPFITTKGYWPRAIQVDAYELMLRLEVEGRGHLAAPLYSAHFGSRQAALEQLANMAEATQRPREAQLLREKLLNHSDAPEAAEPRAARTAATKHPAGDFQKLGALARSADEAGDLARGEDVARQALAAWSRERSAGRMPENSADIVPVRRLLSEIAVHRGDIAEAAALLRQNVVDAATYPLRQAPQGSPFTWKCSNDLAENVDHAASFQQKFGASVIDDNAAEKIKACLDLDIARYTEYPTSFSSITVQTALRKNDQASAEEAVRAILAFEWRRPGDLSAALGDAYVQLTRVGKGAWIVPLLPDIMKALPLEQIQRTVEADKLGIELERFGPLAIIHLSVGPEDHSERLHAFFEKTTKALQIAQQREFDPCLSDSGCEYLGLYAEQKGDAKKASELIGQSLSKYGLNVGTGTNVAGYTDLTIEALRRGKIYESQQRWLAAATAYDVALSSSQLAHKDPDFFVGLRSDAWSGLAKARTMLGARTEALEITSQFFKQLLTFTEKTGGLDGDVILRWSGRLREVVGLHLSLLSSLGDPERAARADEAFLAAQFLQMTGTSATTQKLAARLKAPNAAMQDLVRRYQDLRLNLQAAHRKLAIVENEAAGAAVSEIATLEQALQKTSKDIATKHPDYFQAANLRPVRVGDLKNVIAPGETVALFLENPAPDGGSLELFRFFVSSDSVAWQRVAPGSEPLATTVLGIRCGLDLSAWSGEGEKACASLLGRSPESRLASQLPFDANRAHGLYAMLFGGMEAAMRGRALLVVTSGSLATIPFHVLLTKPLAPGTQVQSFNELSWLAEEHATSVLPSVASLSALRQQKARPTRAKTTFIGFGDPVLSGNSRCGRIVVPSACPNVADTQQNAETEGRSVSAGATDVRVANDNLADLAALKKLCPLPDTAHELKCVAESFGAGPEAILVGDGMTETAVKSAALRQYRVIQFATHGLLARETSRVSRLPPEPALVLTPPANATTADDGLLTSSEIATLKLDADWVVLSACNTAAGSAGSAEPLSGLAQAFFYAGTRALLVSHWSVDSMAATRLTTGTFSALKNDPGISRAEALRRSMMALLADTAATRFQHPALWAPFVVAGEGGMPAAPPAAVMPAARPKPAAAVGAGKTDATKPVPAAAPAPPSATAPSTAAQKPPAPALPKKPKASAPKPAKEVLPWATTTDGM